MQNHGFLSLEPHIRSLSDMASTLKSMKWRAGVIVQHVGHLPGTQPTQIQSPESHMILEPEPTKSDFMGAEPVFKKA